MLTKLVLVVVQIVDQMIDDVLDKGCGPIALPVGTQEVSSVIARLLCHV